MLALIQLLPLERLGDPSDWKNEGVRALVLIGCLPWVRHCTGTLNPPITMSWDFSSHCLYFSVEEVRLTEGKSYPWDNTAGRTRAMSLGLPCPSSLCSSHYPTMPSLSGCSPGICYTARWGVQTTCWGREAEKKHVHKYWNPWWEVTEYKKGHHEVMQGK